ncbi:MAG: hypothetical protein ACTSQP_01470 [Promethearchaeota archaeon]
MDIMKKRATSQGYYMVKHEALNQSPTKKVVCPKDSKTKKKNKNHTSKILK